MQKKPLKVPYWIFVLLITAAAIAYKFFAPVSPADTNTPLDPNARISYTRHAKCRMDCRNITEQDIKAVLLQGHINYQKSDLNDKPCPSYALEHIVEGNRKLRVVIGQCANELKVITCIDLDKDYDCVCP
ncbi:MAG TPA: DUF4258 domain-containing protein [Edaphocola sp.]|nr:DUF4258 domain-containing protein [Edaphocola sp.]